MSICLEKIKHEGCGKNNLQTFLNEETGKVDGYCFSCKQYVSNPYGVEKTKDDVDLPKPKTPEQIEAEIAEIDGYPVVDLPSRKLRGEYLAEFNIRISLSEEDGKTPTATYFPITKGGVVTGYYAKTLDKPTQQWSIGDVKRGEPFNWTNARVSGAYRIIITEGREDAVAVLALYRLFGDSEYLPAIISLPNGVNSVKSSLSQVQNEIKHLFKEVVICFDDDVAGQKAAQEALQMFPQAKTVTLPCKDANACIMEGKKKAAYKALAFKSFRPKNTRILMGGDIHDMAREPTPYGELSWPFPTFQKLLRGVRYGETIYIGGGVKMGKSELLNHIAAHFIREHGVKVMLAKPEEDYKKSYKLLANKIAGEVFTDPDVTFNYEAFDKAGEILNENLMVLDLYQHMGWETLREDIIYAASQGAKAIFIDPITNLTNGMSAGDANAKLQEIAQDLAALAKDLNVVIFIFCHLKEPDGMISHEIRKKKYANGQYVGLGACSHERGGDVLSSQFAGSRGMMRSCNLMIGLEGNKDPELSPNIQSKRWLSILEDREFGNSGKIELNYNKNTTWYREDG